jgi:hypothetical protein
VSVLLNGLRRQLTPVLLGVAASAAVILGLVAFGVLGRASNVVAPSASAEVGGRVASSAALPDSGPAYSVQDISALQELPELTDAQAASLSHQFDSLVNGSANVDPTSARQAAPGIYLARRSDGVSCLIVDAGGMCPSAMLDGGVALFPAAIRQKDNPASPLLLTISGVALDGVSTLALSFSDGSVSATAKVHNNVFQFSVGGHSGADITGYTVDGRTYSLR